MSTAAVVPTGGPKASHTGKVTFYASGDEVRMRIQARNGRTVGPTEGFDSPRNARRALEALRRALVNPLIVDLCAGESSQPGARSVAPRR